MFPSICKHLHKIGVLDIPTCRCGSSVEDTWHYFFACPLYTVPRSTLHSTITSLAPFTLQTILYGSCTCSLLDNELIFSATHDYISATGRFKPSVIGQARSLVFAFIYTCTQTAVLQCRIKTMSPSICPGLVTVILKCVFVLFCNVLSLSLLRKRDLDRAQPFFPIVILFL